MPLLTDLLQEDLNCLKRLLQILEQEQQALLSSDAPAIEALSLEKQQALAQQAQATQARLVHAQQQAGDASEAGLHQLIQQAADKDSLSSQLSEITSLAQQCQAQNRANGRLINQKQEQAQSVLNILRQSDTNTATYYGQGDTARSSQTRSLGKA